MCKNQECEYKPKTNRQAARTPEQIQYGKLWAEIELPKLLNQTTTTTQEVKQ